MKKLTTYILSSFAIAVIFWSFSSCKENRQSHEAKTENVERTAEVPKDTLLTFIQDIVNYISQGNASDSGIEAQLKQWQKKYIFTINNRFRDRLAYIHFGGSLEQRDSLDNGILVISDRLDSSSWLTLKDLEYKFGLYEVGVFDKAKPLPKEPGWYAIYTFRSKNGIPIYIGAHLYGNIIYKIWIKRKWHFSWLLNKDN
ncbi:MAG: hypothetical protein DI598_01105 [Pseudopedobacter saltans]|uniref:Uncharacterized protein n=1 Tax=Pseudopedobacter saltans TaxID=151895 RepID=A0A2W5FD94_9SPHI|nr:MAG: hypothetical protein DI598_01105 [Pseudopedobacter saltans]